MEAISPAALEAVLFASGSPISIHELAELFTCDILTVQNILTELETELDKRHSGLTIHRVAGGCQLVTRSEYFSTVKKLNDIVIPSLSMPALETLSIIAFKQPITKTEIEQIRGVHVDRILARLLDFDFVAEVGRKQVIGRPILYGTTDTFLQSFGLNSLEELPRLLSDEEAKRSLDPQQLALIIDQTDNNSRE